MLVHETCDYKVIAQIEIMLVKKLKGKKVIRKEIERGWKERNR